jgi:hypothetical protein
MQDQPSHLDCLQDELRPLEEQVSLVRLLLAILVLLTLGPLLLWSCPGEMQLKNTPSRK